MKPLEGGPGRKLPEQKPLENTATVLYIGRIPHGFYEDEMKGARVFFYLFIVFSTKNYYLPGMLYAYN